MKKTLSYSKIRHFLQRNKYELLLFALIQHLFIVIILKDLAFYTKVVWPINIAIVGIASVGVFIGKSKWKNILRNILFSLAQHIFRKRRDLPYRAQQFFYWDMVVV